MGGIRTMGDYYFPILDINGDNDCPSNNPQSAIPKLENLPPDREEGMGIHYSSSTIPYNTE